MRSFSWGLGPRREKRPRWAMMGPMICWCAMSSGLTSCRYGSWRSIWSMSRWSTPTEKEDISMTESKPVGFIGLGIMGLPLAEHITKAGYPVTVYNRTIEKAKAVRGIGAKVA